MQARVKRSQIVLSAWNASLRKHVHKRKEYRTEIVLSLGKNYTAEEKKVLRAIYLFNASNHGSCTVEIPAKKGKPHRMSVRVRYPMSDAKWSKLRDAMHLPKLDALTMPQFRESYNKARQEEERIASDLAVQQAALARSLGLSKIIPKDLRPRFECRCGSRFKKKSKLLSHQKLCNVLKDAAEVIELAAFVKAQMKPKEKTNASKAPVKGSKESKRKPVSDKTDTGNSKRKTPVKGKKIVRETKKAAKKRKH